MSSNEKKILKIKKIVFFSKKLLILLIFSIILTVAIGQNNNEIDLKAAKEKAKWAFEAGETHDITAIENLCNATLDDSWMVRCAAINALAKFSNIEKNISNNTTINTNNQNYIIGQTILRRLFDEHHSVRISAARQISKFPSVMPIALLVLQRILESPTEIDSVKVAAAESLGNFGDPSSLIVFQKVWLKLVGKPNAGVTQAIEASLQKIAIYYSQTLLEILNTPQQPIQWRQQIILTFGRLQFLLKEKDERFSSFQKNITPLKNILLNIIQEKKHNTTILSSEIEEFRANALMLYIDIAQIQAVPILQIYLNDSDILVQQIAILGIGKLQHAESLPEIFTKIYSPHLKIVESSLWTISQFPKETILPYIIKSLQDKSKPQKAIIRLVAHFQMIEALPYLLTFYYQNKELQPSIVDTFEILQHKLNAQDSQSKIILDIIKKYNEEHPK